MFNLEDYYSEFRRNTIGYYKRFPTCYGTQRMIYADWTASGRLYRPIEDKIINLFGPYVGNTHSESSITGCTMTKAYNVARDRIKNHVNASERDILIISGFGMTSAVNRLQRMLGLRVPGASSPFSLFGYSNRPLVIVTHMEHHSNYVSWLECDVDVVMIPPDEQGLVNLNYLEMLLRSFENRPYKIGSFTACSNVTGIATPYHEMAKLMHAYNGICLVDLCACAPYEDINMHPEDPMEKLDGIFFSPHKFLGGPGTPGVLIFDSALYSSPAPDNPGGGTVKWTNPWGEYRYEYDIEVSEDGGTPGFLQTMKAAMCIDLKDQMKVKYMLKRERRLTRILLSELSKIKKVHVLQDNIEHRLGIVSFYVEDVHYNLIVKVLNDCFGIQTRGGCSCAGPYGHYLLNIDREISKIITDDIDSGNNYVKPGWVRISVHPIMTDEEICYIVYAVREVVKNIKYFQKHYVYDDKINGFRNMKSREELNHVKRWLRA
jgi:selenocysteine lyase/cysteine desulfurase